MFFYPGGVRDDLAHEVESVLFHALGDGYHCGVVWEQRCPLFQVGAQSLGGNAEDDNGGSGKSLRRVRCCLNCLRKWQIRQVIRILMAGVDGFRQFRAACPQADLIACISEDLSQGGSPRARSHYGHINHVPPHS